MCMYVCLWKQIAEKNLERFPAVTVGSPAVTVGSPAARAQCIRPCGCNLPIAVLKLG